MTGAQWQAGSREKSDRESWIRAAWLLLFAIGLLYLVGFVVIALIRLRYPYELEWMEGGAVLHVQRILEGRPLYAEPSLDFVPYIYTPLYWYLSALVAAVVGNGFAVLRGVSLAAALGSFALIFGIVRRRTSSSAAAFLAAGLFAATYRISGAWFDIARVDSLCLMFLLAGLYLFESPSVVQRSICSPLLLFLAFFSKQSVLLLGVGLSVEAIRARKGKERFVFPLVFGGLTLLSTLVMNGITGGWYGYYVFALPSQHPPQPGGWSYFWLTDLRHLGLAGLIALAWLAGALRAALRGDVRDAGTRDHTFEDVIVFGCLILTSFVSRVHSAGYDNVLMPAFAGICLYGGIGLHRFLEVSKGRSVRKGLILAAVLVQFLVLFYRPQAQVPTEADRKQGDLLLRRMSQIPGEIYWSSHPWYLTMLGKPSQAQAMAVFDVLRASGSEKWRQRFNDEMTNRIAGGRYQAFVTDAEDFLLREPEFDRFYGLAEKNLSGAAFVPVTGGTFRPTFLFLKRDAPSGRTSSYHDSW